VNNCGQTVSCESCTGECDPTTNTCCTNGGYCANGHECGTGLDNCHVTVTCGSCVDFCSNGGTCNASTGICTCRCVGGVAQTQSDGLHPNLEPCLPN
jgi:hypothetical protein